MLKLPAAPAGPRGRVWVACSGGGDSLALLHALVAVGTPRLRVVHVHHGLQAAADGWVRQLRRWCREFAVPLSVRRVSIAADDPEGPEAAARRARYAVMAALLRPGDLLVTAHHREDQAETVLLRALRGTGIGGLAAMRALQPLGAGQLWRPLLNTPKAELQRYLAAQGLSGIDDPHNHDPRYARSYLRETVWPTLAAHWPQAAASLNRLAAHASDAEQILQQIAASDAVALQRNGGLSVEGLLALDHARRRNLLHHQWMQLGALPPAAAVLERLEREVLQARSDAQPCLRVGDLELRRYRDTLYLMPALPALPADVVLEWPATRRKLQLPPGCGRLRAPRAPPLALTVRFARGGERLRPAGSRHTRTLKQLCQEAGVPVWVRQRMPLLYERAELLSAGAIWNHERLHEIGWKPSWDNDLPGLHRNGTLSGHEAIR